jgi:flagellar motility protein MotE (MotC chaperone)
MSERYAPTEQAAEGVIPMPATTASAKKPNGAPPAKPRAKKPMSKGAAISACIVVFVFILGGLAACLLTNAGGLGDKLIAVMPQYKKAEADLQSREMNLAASEANAQADAYKNADDAKANAKAAEDLKAREDALKAAQQALDAQKQDALSAEQRKKAVIEVYSDLDETKAAAMLASAPTLQEAADILTMLPADKAAGILAAMDADKAYELTKLMMQ